MKTIKHPQEFLNVFIKNFSDSINKKVDFKLIGSCARNIYTPGEKDIDFIVNCADGYFDGNDVAVFYLMLEENKRQGYYLEKPDGRLVSVLDGVIFFNQRIQDLIKKKWDVISHSEVCLRYSKGGIARLIGKI